MPISNNADAYKLHYNMLHLTGIWPLKHPSVSYRIRNVLSWILGTTFSITMTIQVIHVIGDITKLSTILDSMISVVTYVLKLGVFTYYTKLFLKTIDFLKDPIFVSYPEHLDNYMAKTIKISTFIANLYRYLCLTCIILFTLYPIFDNQPLPFPFDYAVGRYRYYMYVFQITSVSTVAWNNSTLDTLTTCLMGIAAAQLDILRRKIELTGSEEETGFVDEQKVLRELKQCVKHHMAIIKFVESIDRIFRVGLLVQFVASIVTICNTLFHFVLISATSLQFVLVANYFAVMFTELSVYCWYGNEVIVKSLRLGEACYNSTWYRYSPKTGRYLFLIMERSKRPLAVTAFKFSTLSLSALTSILRWSYSYLTLLLNLYRKQFMNSGGSMSFSKNEN